MNCPPTFVAGDCTAQITQDIIVRVLEQPVGIAGQLPALLKGGQTE